MPIALNPDRFASRAAWRPLRLLALLAAATAPLAACVSAPDGTSPEDVAFYEAAVASLDCTIKTEREYRTVEFQAGLTRAQAVAISGYELGAERAVRMDDGGIRLVAGPCAPDVAPIPLVDVPKEVRFTGN